MSTRHLLRLYVTGTTARSDLAVRNLERIMGEGLVDQYELEIIDVLERPQLAEDEKIIATPTLIRHLPAPARRIIGDFSDREQVIDGLDLKPA